MSPGELAFYRTLLEAVGGRYAVCCKVRLADVLDCRPAAWALGYGRLIAQKHLDFVLVDHATTRIVAAVELDDRSHARPKRRARDEFVNRATEAAGVRLYRVRAAASYNARRVSDLLCI